MFTKADWLILAAAFLVGGSEFGSGSAANEEEIAGASLDHLALDGFHPHAAGRECRQLAVGQGPKEVDDRCSIGGVSRKMINLSNLVLR